MLLDGDLLPRTHDLWHKVFRGLGFKRWEGLFGVCDVPRIISSAIKPLAVSRQPKE
jgi:hypothetical protein